MENMTYNSTGLYELVSLAIETCDEDGVTSSTSSPMSPGSEVTVHRAIKAFENTVEMTRVTGVCPTTTQKLTRYFQSVCVTVY